jgi:parallel beta-helix repeat protein
VLACALLAWTFAQAGRARAVDGVIEINQARATQGGIAPGDTPGFPITISADTLSSEPMSFRLTGPLFNSTTENAIEIISPNVTVDLNGFMIACPVAPCAGVGIQSTQRNITIMNGTLRGFADGVNIGANGAQVENVRALGNTNAGVHLSSDCIVRNNIAAGNGTDGIMVGVGCTVSGNTANSNATSGIRTGPGSNVFGNTVRGNTAFGLSLAPDAGYSQNVISGNGMGTVSGGVPTGNNLCNGNTTCP